jgi:hypothetical protein
MQVAVVGLHTAVARARAQLLYCTVINENK